MLLYIRQLLQRLQSANHKAYYLAFLRVALSVWLLIEILFRWRAWDVLYSNKSFLNFPVQDLYFLHNYFFAFKENYKVIIGVFILLLLLNIAGIGRHMVAGFLFLTYAVLYAISNRYSNGGDQMALLLLLYLSVANTFTHLTIFKQKALTERKEKLYNLLSNLAAYSIMINLCLVYFTAGLSKLQSPLWLSGDAIYFLLNGERFFAFGGDHHHIELPAAIGYILNYGTILLELAMPVLVWYKRTRVITFLLLIAMHLAIYFFLMIYGMSVIFVIQYGLFFSQEEIKNGFKKVKRFFIKKTPWHHSQ